jgi:N-acyl-D-aspartate/D-glutamate deacylase
LSVAEATAAPFDVVIRGGLCFDGSGADGVLAAVGVGGGEVVAIAREGDEALAGGREEIDARGCWVTPGFVDLHTHYDAEVEVAPELIESLRHGVTTVMLGSCSLSAALGEPEDIADIFCRVEGVPRAHMLPMLQARKDWHTLPAYLDHLDTLPLGPNVAAYVGHSNLRMAVMGFARSVDARARPTAAERATMRRMLTEALDAGYVGLSAQTLPWDKLDGTRERSKPLPGTFASWSEIRELTALLRARGRVFQGVPNLVTKLNVLLFLWESVGLWRPRLRTTVISWMDVIADRKVDGLVRLLLGVFRGLLGAEFRFQALPNPFEVRADGMDLVIFEEFGAGGEALHLADLGARADLLRDPAYRARFLRQWRNVFSPRIYHRDFARTTIEGCPDASVVGRSFADVAAERGTEPALAFLDLCAEHGDALRWHSVVANDRPDKLARIVAHPGVLIGFSDAGAHLRNMAFYDYPLKLLRLVRDAELRGAAPMSVGRAVHRLTAEIADFYGLDAGRLRVGDRADVVVVDPAALDAELDTIVEREMPGFPGLRRLVNHHPRAVRAVLVNGRVAVAADAPRPGLGSGPGFGRVLRVGAD